MFLFYFSFVLLGILVYFQSSFQYLKVCYIDKTIVELRENISLRIFSDSEASASELLENL